MLDASDADSSTYAHFVFNVFDQDRDGTVSFEVWCQQHIKHVTAQYLYAVLKPIFQDLMPLKVRICTSLVTVDFGILMHRQLTIMIRYERFNVFLKTKFYSLVLWLRHLFFVDILYFLSSRILLLISKLQLKAYYSHNFFHVNCCYIYVTEF